MHVTFVSPYGLRTRSVMGGGSRIFLDVATALASREHITVLYCKYASGSRLSDLYQGIEMHRLRQFPSLAIMSNRITGALDLPYVLPLFANTFWRKKGTLVVLDDPRPCVLPGFDKKVLNLHYVPSFVPSHVNKFLCRLRGIDLLICCSRFVKRRVETTMPFLSRKVDVVYNGIECERFMNTNGQRVRTSLGIDPNDVVVLYVGQITEGKGLHVLIEAFNLVHDSFPKTSMIVVGSSKVWGGSKQDEIYERRMIQKATGLPIHFVGTIQAADVPEYYAASDIFVCPSIFEEAGGPLVNLQAMASGKPVVATRVGGVPEFVIDGETGILVPADAHRMSDAICVLTRDSNLRVSYGKRGQDVALTRFSKQRMLDEYVRVIEAA
jgi:glycosyltransferase involved in cell wall biosynthesis